MMVHKCKPEMKTHLKALIIRKCLQDFQYMTDWKDTQKRDWQDLDNHLSVTLAMTEERIAHCLLQRGRPQKEMNP